MLSRGLEPTPFLATEFNERAARLSSDGQWVAYVSDQAGDDRVYVQPFPGGGQVVPVSAGPGTEPVWARDGRRLFYRNGSEMFEVEVTTGPSFTASTPRLLFDEPYRTNPDGLANYDVSIDGERFLMMSGSSTTEASIVLVQNWHQELLERVPVN